MNTEYDVWLGLDVGKTDHHGCGLVSAGERAYDHELPQDEAALRDVITSLQDGHGRVLVIVDQPNTIGALPVAVARDCGADIAYLPGLAMRKAADLYPGQSKTDTRDVNRSGANRSREIGRRRFSLASEIHRRTQSSRRRARLPRPGRSGHSERGDHSIETSQRGLRRASAFLAAELDCPSK
jgi:hypothetical protein